ncbi:uncharacterized protein WM294_007815 [Sarcoramphus papa]
MHLPRGGGKRVPDREAAPVGGQHHAQAGLEHASRDALQQQGPEHTQQSLSTGRSTLQEDGYLILCTPLGRLFGPSSHTPARAAKSKCARSAEGAVTSSCLRGPLGATPRREAAPRCIFAAERLPLLTCSAPCSPCAPCCGGPRGELSRNHTARGAPPAPSSFQLHLFSPRSRKHNSSSLHQYVPLKVLNHCCININMNKYWKSKTIYLLHMGKGGKKQLSLQRLSDV